MQLSKFTDLGIRVLLLLSNTTKESLTIADVADRLSVSKNHLTKIVHFMSKQKWILTVRGKNGGIQLANSPETYKVGYLIRVLEGYVHSNYGVVNCHTPKCILIPACRLPTLLNTAMNEFYSHLDQYNLQDILSSPIEYIIPLRIN